MTSKAICELLLALFEKELFQGQQTVDLLLVNRDFFNNWASFLN